MATQRNVRSQHHPEPDPFDDLPDFFDDRPLEESRAVQHRDTHDLPEEMGESTPDDTSNGYANTVGLSLDELNQRSLDDQRDEAERAKIDPPRGDWLKTERFQHEIRTNGADRMPGDLDPAGRTIINISGRPNERTVDGQTYHPMLFIRLSPDIRYKQDDPTKHDNAYKMWLFARELFVEINDRKATRIGDIVSMMEDEEYLITTLKGDTGPIAIGLKHRDYLKRRNRRNR